VCAVISYAPSNRILAVMLLSAMCLLIIPTPGSAAKKEKKKDYVMTEIELQSELMSYADRFASIMAQSFEDFDALKPSPEARRFILDDMVHSISSMFTTAAEPNPQTALLDMVSITTLGRMIYEDNLRKRFGKPVEVMARGFGELENDVWQIAAKILAIEQQHELRAVILDWRKRNPEKVIYNYFRFSEFAADRRKSTLVKKDGTGGLFKSVQQATQQVEETRMLAERGLYLATRMPLLTGAFTEVWMTQLLLNPEASKILQDVHNISGVSQRLATVAEELPDQLMKDISRLRVQTIDQIMKGVDVWSEKTVNDVMARVAIERQAFIDQLIDRFVGEKKIILEAILAEQQKYTELAAELRQLIEGSNTLLLTANTLTENLNLGGPSGESTDSKPFDIKDYQDTIAEVTTLVESTNKLVATAGLETLIPQLIEAIDRVEGEGEELIDHSFGRALILILISMVAYVIARLVYNVLNKKLIESKA
jgi:hypothetical protein